jgi:hypothetical protein
VSGGIPGRQGVGIDLHPHRSAIARVDETGNEPGWVQIDNDPKMLVVECRKAGPGAPAVIQATHGCYWAVDALHAAKFDVHLAHPSGMKALRKRKRVKTDPRDAYGERALVPRPSWWLFPPVTDDLDPAGGGLVVGESGVADRAERARLERRGRVFCPTPPKSL